MQLRSAAERLRQTLAFELGGIIIVSPLYALLLGANAAASITIIVLLSVIVMVWSPVHNTIFDWIELRRTGRAASDRPHWLRAVHAVSHEVTAIALTLPVLLRVGGLSLHAAIAVDVGLTLFYVAYAYVFDLGYDRLRPVATAPSISTQDKARA